MPSTAIIIIASLLAATIIIVIVMSSSSSQVSDPNSNDDILLDDSESDDSGLLQLLTESPQEINIETQEITNNVIQEIIQEDASGVVVSDASGVVVSDASGVVVSDASGLVVSDASGLVVSDASGVVVTDASGNTEVDMETLLDNEREIINDEISSSLDDMNQTTENFREDMSGIDIFDIAACDIAGNEDHIKCPNVNDIAIGNLIQLDKFGDKVKQFYTSITTETQEDLILELQSNENMIRKSCIDLINTVKKIYDYKYFYLSSNDTESKAEFVKCYNLLLMNFLYPFSIYEYVDVFSLRFGLGTVVVHPDVTIDEVRYYKKGGGLIPTLWKSGYQIGGISSQISLNFYKNISDKFSFNSELKITHALTDVDLETDYTINIPNTSIHFLMGISFGK